MTGSRHRRSEGSGEPAGLPSWAQRHLDEAGAPDGPAAATTHRRRPAARSARSAGPARSASDSPLRGWGLAILSVAAAVTAVPVAIAAVANDRSGDPLPTVDTFTAGAPGPLQGGQSAAGGQGGQSADRRGTTEVGDPATGGVLDVPGAPAAAPAPVVVPVPQPAAVVRPTPPPATITPRAATPTTAAEVTTPAKPTSTTTDEGKSATKPTGTTKPTSGSKPSTSDDDGGSGGDGGTKKGLVPRVVDTAGGLVGGVAKGLL
jgi:hypothetical protein